MEETKEMDFQVITELPVVVFNVEELKSQALALVEKYDGLVFTEEEIPAVRRDMTMLNGLAERLERARIDTAKQMMAPIKEFEAQIKEVSAILLKTREALGSKVQVYVQQQKEIRRAAVLQAIEDIRAGYMTFCSAMEVQLVASTHHSHVHLTTNEGRECVTLKDTIPDSERAMTRVTA